MGLEGGRASPPFKPRPMGLWVIAAVTKMHLLHVQANAVTPESDATVTCAAAASDHHTWGTNRAHNYPTYYVG
jgi:hypothetical protein